MHVWSCCRCRLSPRDIYLSELQPSPDALFSIPTIFNVVLLVVLFNLYTLIRLDARPHPNDFLILKNLRNLILRSSDTTTRLTPRGEVAPATSFDQPIKITTIFDPLFPEPTFTGSTIFDPFHPSEAGRSIPATPKAAQLTPVSTGPDPINSDYITSSWDIGTGLATSITQLVTFYTPEFTVCLIRPVGSGYSLLAVQGAQNDTATPPTRTPLVHQLPLARRITLQPSHPSVARPSPLLATFQSPSPTASKMSLLALITGAPYSKTARWYRRLRIMLPHGIVSLLGYLKAGSRPRCASTVGHVRLIMNCGVSEL